MAERTQRLLTEWSQLWRVAWPVFISQICYTGMAFVDTVVGGRHSVDALAGIAVGAGLWLPISLFLTGTAYALTPRVAYAKGENDTPEVHQLIGAGLALALLLGLIAWGFLTVFGGDLLNAFGVVPETQTEALPYLATVAFGLVGYCLFQAKRAVLIGLGDTRPETLVAIACVTLNFPLSYVLAINLDLGALGCGIATAIIFWSAALGLGAYLQIKKRLPLFVKAPNLGARLMSLWRFGWPIGLAIFIEASVFSIVALFLGPFGSVEIAAHQIALNLSAMFFMLPLAISLAATGRIGELRGRGEAEQAWFSARAALALGIALAATTCVITLAFRGPFIALYGASVDVYSLAFGLIVFAAIYQIPDSIQVIGAGLLRGYEDSQGPLRVALVSYWVVALPGGFWLGRVLGWGAAGFWTFLIVGLSVASLGMLWLLHRRREGQWRFA